MYRILKFGLTSIGVPLFVTVVTLRISKYIENKEKKKILKVNLLILIKDIQDLLSHLETVIMQRKILDPYTLQTLNYNQILIDYNNFYPHKDQSIFIYNLLDFYHIRTKIKKQIIEVVEIPKISDHLDRQLNTSENNVWVKGAYVNFVEDVYKELEVIFIKNNLQNQLIEWDKMFKFKSLEEVREERNQMLLTKKKELKYEIKRIKNENNIDLEKKELKPEEKELLDEIYNLQCEYSSQKAMEDYHSKNEFTSFEEACYVIKLLYKEIYDIKVETEKI